MLQLDYEGGKSWQYSWPTAPHAPDPRVEAVSAWLLAHKIGGW
jgi:hypothetical protein